MRDSSRLALALVVESNERRRVWDEVLPLLAAETSGLLMATPFRRGPLHDQVEALGVHALALGAKSSRGYPLAAARLARVIRERGIDVVQGTEPIPAVVGGMAGLLARRGVRVYHRQHLELPSGRLTFLSRAAARLNTVTLACSAAAAERAHALDGIRRDRIYVAHNGANRMRTVSARERAGLRQRLGIAEDAGVIAVVSRLRQEKGIGTLLSALPSVQEAVTRPVVAVIAGNGPDEPDFHAMARELHEPRVVFSGFQEDVALWYAIGDVVAMPSHREAFGVSAAEAMSCGRPLVASAVGGLLEVVEDGETGILVPPRDPAALAAALARLLSDEQERLRLGRAAQALFEARFTNAAMVHGWLRCYASALNR